MIILAQAPPILDHAPATPTTRVQRVLVIEEVVVEGCRRDTLAVPLPHRDRVGVADGSQLGEGVVARLDGRREADLGVRDEARLLPNLIRPHPRAGIRGVQVGILLVGVIWNQDVLVLVLLAEELLETSISVLLRKTRWLQGP